MHIGFVYEYQICKYSTLFKGIIGAYFLKWMNNGTINIVYKLETNDEKNYCLDFTKEVSISDKLERELYDIIKSAANDNKLLESKEFEKWCKDNYEIIFNWNDNIQNIVLEKLNSMGLVKNVAVVKRTLLGKINDVSYEVDIKVRDEAIKLSGLKKFLNDFTLINEREPIEVHLWNEYLIYAELLGIADKVRIKFKELYPNLTNQKNIFNDEIYDNIATIFINDCYNGAIAGYNKAHRYHDSYSDSGYSSSSGGGFR